MIDMPQPRQILASAAAALMFFMLTACGQTGGLYLPQTPKGVERATLGQTLLRWPGHDAADEDDVPAATAAAAAIIMIAKCLIFIASIFLFVYCY